MLSWGFFVAIQMFMTASSLSINLTAIANNWRLLNQQSATAETAAVVKANAYGLGAAQISSALWQAGCRCFFVAHLEEAAELRSVLPEAEIHVLNGLTSDPTDYLGLEIQPILNSLDQIALWSKHDPGTRCFIHIDTGMARLGLDAEETEDLVDNPDLLKGLKQPWLMSHLASAEEADNLENDLQLEQIAQVKRQLGLPTCFANSSGIFLGPDYHFELLRPGVALYGANPTPGKPNPMQTVVSLTCPIIQIRDIPKGQPVGYNGTWRADTVKRIATVPLGYADGFARTHSSDNQQARTHLYWQGQAVPVVGRVSMDLVTLDITEIKAPAPQVGDALELLGPNQSLDQLAASCGTIGYEILTSLGRRYARTYID